MPLREVDLLLGCDLSKQQDFLKHSYRYKQTKQRANAAEHLEGSSNRCFFAESNHFSCVWLLFSRRDDFNIKVLQAFVELHEFADLNLVQALRWEKLLILPQKTACMPHFYTSRNIEDYPSKTIMN